MDTERNVQAKFASTANWHNFGSVKLVEAAECLLRNLYAREVINNKPYTVHVRYEATPDTVWTVEVTRKVVYQCKPLRFDHDDE